ncbi:hypothetical protein EDD86DRAFT_140165 [Gorgonomyces haynaldii]|nr:hypothetical protein EDD86DRAFT_140165 [Gorgonomyces haynaldii]
MTWTLPPELLQHVAQYTDLKTYSHLMCCSRVLLGLLCPIICQFKPEEMIELIRQDRNKIVEHLVTSQGFQSPVLLQLFTTMSGRMCSWISMVLQEASKKSMVQVVQKLLLDKRYNEHYTALSWSRFHTQDQDPQKAFEIFKLLWPSMLNYDVANVLADAVQAGHQEIFDFVYDDGMVLFNARVQEEYESESELVLSALGAAINTGNFEVCKHFYYHTQFDLDQILEAFEEFSEKTTLDIVKFLVAQHMLARDNEFFNVFCRAIRFGKKDIVTFLLDYVKPQHCNFYALYYGCLFGQFEIVRMLLRLPKVNYPGKKKLLQVGNVKLFRTLFENPQIPKDHDDDICFELGERCVTNKSLFKYLLNKEEDLCELLMVCCEYGTPEQMLEILTVGIESDMIEFATSYAAEYSKPENIKLLANGGEYDFEENHCKAIRCAFLNKHPETARHIVRKHIPEIPVDTLSDWMLYVETARWLAKHYPRDADEDEETDYDSYEDEYTDDSDYMWREHHDMYWMDHGHYDYDSWDENSEWEDEDSEDDYY